MNMLACAAWFSDTDEIRQDHHEVALGIKADGKDERVDVWNGMQSIDDEGVCCLVAGERIP